MGEIQTPHSEIQALRHYHGDHIGKFRHQIKDLDTTMKTTFGNLATALRDPNTTMGTT